MTQYFFVDESGDPGLEGEQASSSHFVLAMVQAAQRASHSMSSQSCGKHLAFQPTFEFQIYKTATAQKHAFFQSILPVPFRVRTAVVLDKIRHLTYELGVYHPRIEMTRIDDPDDLSCQRTGYLQ